MLLPKYLRQRGDIYYVRRALPLDVQAAFGRKEIWVSLRTTSRREAEVRSHAAIAKITGEIEAKRREMRAAEQEREFVGSERFTAALRPIRGDASLEGGGQGYARRARTAEEQASVSMRPQTRPYAPAPEVQSGGGGADRGDLAELEAVRSRASLVRSVDPDGEPDFGSSRSEYVAGADGAVAGAVRGRQAHHGGAARGHRGHRRGRRHEAHGRNGGPDVADRARRALEGAPKADAPPRRPKRGPPSRG